MTKKLLFIGLLWSVFNVNGQVLSYADQAVLFSQKDRLGTARYMAMGGAFGALGGDLTAVDINPAGLAVFNTSMIASTLSYRNTDITSEFYGTYVSNSDDYFNLTQAGGVIVFDTNNNSGFTRFNMGFNFNTNKDFENNFVTTGNSGVPEFIDDPWLNYDDDPTNDVYYTNVDNQYFQNFTSGTNDSFVMSFAAQMEKYLYIGASLTFHNLDFNQNTYYEELNNDGGVHTLDAYNWQRLSTYGSGFNFGVGAIVKPIQSLRLGLSYQSPIWYNLTERYIEDLEIFVSTDPEPYTEYYDPNYFDYKLKTPSILTGSMALVFGKNGLLSMDYIYKDYSDTKLQPSSAFIDDNTELKQNLKGTSSYRFGTEWRINMVSLRGGYTITQDPYKNSAKDFDAKGYSLGLGINFSNHFSLDMAFDKSEKNDQYQFLNISGVEPANLSFENERFTTTLVYKF